MGTVFLLSIVWIAPLVCFLLVNEAKFKKNIVVGVTLPFEAREDSAVQAVLNRFKMTMYMVCGFLVALAVIVWWKLPDSMTLWLLWIDLCIILPYVPYVWTNCALKKLKRQRGWGPAAGQQVRVDISAIPQDKWISPWIFLPPVVISLAPLTFSRSMWAMNVTLAVCCILFWLGYRYCYRNKSEMIDENVELTRVLTRVRQYNWGRMWLLASYSMALLGAGIAASAESVLWSTVLFVAFTVIIVAGALWVELSVRRVQEKLTRESGREWYVDEDDHWIGGILYYNTNDSRLVINNRVGMNSSINAAHPAGKILTVLLIVFLLALPFAGTFIGGGDVLLTLDDQAVMGANGRTEYVIELEDVQSVQLMEELPDNMIRNFGTAMPQLLKGDFTASEIGHVKVCLDPTVPPFVLIETEEGRRYLLGSREPGEAEEVYGQIIK